MNAHLVIRELEPGDFQRWLSLWIGYNEFYGRTGAKSLSAKVTATTWGRLLDPGEELRALVAEVDSAFVGLAHYLFHPSTSSIAPYCYLEDLFTRPEARGQGVATALVSRVCEEAKQTGAGRVYWQTHEANCVARRVYDKIAERSGFIIYRRFV